jgi:antirestriction protein ArdC
MKKDGYQVVTDRIIGLLEQGTIPWQKPWNGGEMAPRNLVSQREYRGVNVFLLHAMMYESPFWLTFHQAKELGGHVREGEKAYPVVFWKCLDVEDKGEPTGKKTVPFLRYYSVFNVAQCEGIPHDKIPAQNGNQTRQSPIYAAEKILEQMPKRPEIRNGGARACYWPNFDRVDMQGYIRMENRSEWAEAGDEDRIVANAIRSRTRNVRESIAKAQARAAEKARLN